MSVRLSGASVTLEVRRWRTSVGMPLGWASVSMDMRIAAGVEVHTGVLMMGVNAVSFAC
jgi:hypothetical protein